MNTSWKSELPQLGIIAALFAWSVIIWPSVPESLPLHFLFGNPGRVGGRFEVLFAVPVASLAIYAILRFAPRLDPARANYPSFAAPYAVIRIAVLIMLAMLDLAILLPLAGVPVDRGEIIRLAVGGLLVVLGAVMGKIRPNWFVGIRTPWTLTSKESWVKTHRLGGWVFILSGLAFIVLLPLPAVLGMVLSFGILAIGLVWIIVYSYLVWQKDPVRYPAIRSRPAGG